MAYSVYTGTSGNNFILFNGVSAYYSATLINAYSGYTLSISKTMNVNNSVYDGLGGTDTLSMTAMGDVLSLVDADGTIMIRNIEIISAGLDGDIVNLADALAIYGNVQIRGSDGDDILWSNVGNDSVFGGQGDDIIDGGPGNDVLFGEGDDDYIAGGAGADSLFGGSGDDTLVYNADAVWTGGITLGNLGSAIPFGGQILLDGLNRSHDIFNGDAEQDLSAPVQGIDRLILTAGHDVLVISDTISPVNNSAYLPRVSYIDIIDAGDGNDIVDLSGRAYDDVTINGGNGNDILAGSGGNDTINGDDGNDRLFGAGGDDILSGGTGDDEYSYRLGDGNDIIRETSGTDTISFGTGIALGDIGFSVSGNDLVLSIGTGSIHIENHFTDDMSGRVETIRFDDGTTYNLGAYTPPAAPVAYDDSFAGSEDQPVTGNLLANDTDANGDVLTAQPETLTTAQGGSVTINADGTFTYTGAANYNGADAFSYTVLDGNGGSATGEVSINLGAVNDAPAAADDSFSGFEDMAITGSVLDNDSDVDGDALSVDAQTIQTANGGSVTINADGTFSYSGAANYNGPDSFSYTVRDTSGAAALGTVLLSVAAVNDAPAAKADEFSGLRGADISGNVLADNGSGADSDIDGDTLSVTPQSITTAQGGTVTLLADGSFTYQAAHDFIGTDSFDYTLLDGQGGSDTQTVTLSVSIDGTKTIAGTNGGEDINGTSGNDEIFALGGNDIVKGQDGDDRILGGDGDDVLYGDDGILGGAAFDKQFSDSELPTLKERTNIADLNPSAVPYLGIKDGNLNVSADGEASITFRKGYAGYDNSFGSYAVAADGSIVNATMLWANVKTAGIDTAHSIDLPTGAGGGDFGFFIIADGNNTNQGYAGLSGLNGEGNIQFVHNYGKADARTAKITDAGSKISIVYSDGVTTKLLSGNAYFTTDRGESTALNRDGKSHVVSGLTDTNNLDLNIKKADLASKPAEFTKDGITLTALTGALVGVADNKVGIKSAYTSGGDAVSGSEAMRVSVGSAEKIVLTLNGLSAGDRAIDLKVYVNGDLSHPVNYEVVTSGIISGGKASLTLDSAAFGGLITAVDISSVANSSHGTHHFYLENVHADMPGLDTGALRIGFEDLYNTGDADYEDVLFDLDIKPVTLADTAGGDDYLDGGAGNDTLYGEGGNDILIIGLGLDHAYGGAGADTFALTKIDSQIDVIHDFRAADGDVINITDVLEQFDPLSDDIAQFVHLVQNGGNTEIQINANGGADSAFVTAAVILGGLGGASLDHLLTDGSIVANQSAQA